MWSCLKSSALSGFPEYDRGSGKTDMHAKCFKGLFSLRALVPFLNKNQYVFIMLLDQDTLLLGLLEVRTTGICIQIQKII